MSNDFDLRTIGAVASPTEVETRLGRVSPGLEPLYIEAKKFELLPDNNPKSAFGLKKPPLHLIPQPFLVILSKVMNLGASKYGPFNWRSNSVAASVYVAAAMRHIASYYDGEDKDPESGVSHLAHAAACMAILIDAQSAGNLIDDRPPAGVTAQLIKEHTEQ